MCHLRQTSSSCFIDERLKLSEIEPKVTKAEVGF